MAVSREELFKAVWLNPMTAVAKGFGVSSSFLSRVCERLRVPHPTRGYWAKLAVGKAPAQPNLPEARPGDELEWNRDGEAKRAPGIPQGPPMPSRRRRHTTLSGLHELTGDAHQHFEGVRELENGFLKPTKKLLVDVSASRPTIQRALELANKLFVELEDRGYRVVFAPHGQKLYRLSINPDDHQQYRRPWSPNRPTIVYVGTVAFGLTIYELTEEAEVEWTNGKYVRVTSASTAKRRGYSSSESYRYTSTRQMPSGKLCLRAYSPYSLASWKREWRESASGDLSAKFGTAIRKLEAETGAILKLLEEGARKAEQFRLEWEAQQLQYRRELEERHRIKATQESREQLLKIVEAWALATRIEAFFDDIERRAPRLTEGDKDQVTRRLQGARGLLGGIDALEHFRGWKSPEER
jgi:hypothetical protein